MHLFLGLISGIVVFIVGVTGCIYAFIDEIKPIVYEERLFIENPERKRKSLAEQFMSARNALDKTLSIYVIYLANENNRTTQFRANSVKNETGIWYWNDKDYRTYYIDPYSLGIVMSEDSVFEFFNFIVALHTSLLLKPEIGEPIVGYAVLIFVITLITGLVLWIPKRVKGLRQRLWFQWKSTTRWKRKNYDLHSILGFYVMIFALTIALTGLTWAFDWIDDTLQWFANGGKKTEVKTQKIVSDVSQGAITNSLDIVHADLKIQFPEARSYTFSLPKDEIGPISVFVNNGNRRDNILIRFDQYSGKELKRYPFDEKTNGQKLSSFYYDIHVGAIFGLPGKILAFFASLISASLPITGFLIWWGRKKKKKPAGRKRPAQL